jgi:hypothetical protein
MTFRINLLSLSSGINCLTLTTVAAASTKLRYMSITMQCVMLHNTVMVSCGTTQLWWRVAQHLWCNVAQHSYGVVWHNIVFLWWRVAHLWYHVAQHNYGVVWHNIVFLWWCVAHLWCHVARHSYGVMWHNRLILWRVAQHGYLMVSCGTTRLSYGIMFLN